MIKTLTALFTIVDDFCLEFDDKWLQLKLSNHSNSRNRKGQMTLSEIMTILVAFQLSDHRHFKGYFYFLQTHHRTCFPNLVCYSRFVELTKGMLGPMLAFFSFVKAEAGEVSFIDSTPISVCNTKRIHNHRVFDGLATRGKSTMGWYFGFKLHLIINQYGAPISFKLTKGNADDRSVVEDLSKNLRGKIFGDKGYISRSLFKSLFSRGLHLVTAIKKNMKPQIITQEDSTTLKKRGIVEGVFNIMKNMMHLAHSRHRSVLNFMVNTVGVVIGYSLKHLKCRDIHAKKIES
jgi:hypothetical protein